MLISRTFPARGVARNRAKMIAESLPEIQERGALIQTLTYLPVFATTTLALRKPMHLYAHWDQPILHA